jgi:hypothetical protein
MPLGSAVYVVLLDWPTLFLALYVVGASLSIRNRSRLGRSASPAIWGYSLLTLATVCSMMIRLSLLTTQRPSQFSQGEGSLAFAGSLTVVSVVLSFAGACLLLAAILRAQSKHGAV